MEDSLKTPAYRAVAIMAVLLLAGCTTLDSSMMRYRTLLAGKVGKMKMDEAKQTFGEPVSAQARADGQEQWLYVFRPENQRGEDNLFLVFDKYGYLSSWHCNVER